VARRRERGAFRYKDYRRNGQARYRIMTLAPEEFIRRFLLHVRHSEYGRHRDRSSPPVSLLRWPHDIVEIFERGGAPRGPPPSDAGVRTATP
jgi:hypothetical protein